MRQRKREITRKWERGRDQKESHREERQRKRDTETEQISYTSAISEAPAEQGPQSHVEVISRLHAQTDPFRAVPDAREHLKPTRAQTHTSDGCTVPKPTEHFKQHGFLFFS